jgi:hypothetical protein
VKIAVFKYIITICLLLSISESNGIPVLSGFFARTSQNKQSDNSCAESPANEAEMIKAESAKDYLHQTFAFYFHSPVFTIPVKHHVRPDLGSRRSFYPDVLTPPPNC